MSVYKNLISLFSTLSLIASCTTTLDNSTEYSLTLSLPTDECFTILDELNAGVQMKRPESLTDGVIIGKKLENPYSLKVMQQAYKRLYPNTKSVGDTLQPNCAYIRFLPVNTEDVNYLCDSELELYNYPLDYEIIGDPSDYHDATVSDNQITWQYTVISLDDPVPPVNHEILDLGYIPDEMESELETEAIISNGFSLNDFEECLTPNVRSVEDFIELLIEHFPAYESIIRNSFM